MSGNIDICNTGVATYNSQQTVGKTVHRQEPAEILEEKEYNFHV